MGILNNTWTFHYVVDVLFVFKEKGRLLNSCFKYPNISVIMGLSLSQEGACAESLVVDGPCLDCNGDL
jgi:hypothetical protein